jgi:EAL domain-containing protein (putative c-di-GMP-specific phosphodiesterase class I)
MDPLEMLQKKTQTLPSYQDELFRIKSFLKESDSLALLFIDASGMSKIEKVYGKKLYGEVLGVLRGLILKMQGKEVRSDDLITVYGIEGEKFLIFLSRKREHRGFHTGDLESMAMRIASFLNSELYSTVHHYLKTRPKITVGHAITIYNPLIQEERQIYKLIEDAKQMAHYQQFRDSMRNKEKIQELIIKEAITTYFQPIVRLSDYELLGYEALSRGPLGTEYESPSLLFDSSHEADMAFELDRFCRKRAFENAKLVKLNRQLFINCLPAAIHDPEFKGKPLEALLNEVGLVPSQIVMEISERYAIENYEMFRQAVSYYKEIGFSIAIDDTGAGHSSLETVVELRPQVLKLDLSLVHGVADNKVKQELVRAIVTLADSMQCQVIAEGIETREELDILYQLNVPYGQGYYIGRPAPTLIIPEKG